MRKALAATASAGALLFAAATPAATAAPSERACANEHGTHVAHATVPQANHTAHMKIPHFCME